MCVVCVRGRGWKKGLPGGGGRDGGRDGRRLAGCREHTRTSSGCGNGGRRDCSFSRLKKRRRWPGRGPMLDGARDWLREKKEEKICPSAEMQCPTEDVRSRSLVRGFVKFDGWFSFRFVSVELD